MMTRGQWAARATVLGLGLSWGIAAAAWTRPAAPTKARAVRQGARLLARVDISVNGSTRSVERNQTLRVVRGDTLQIVRAVLANGKESVSRVNLVGFINGSHAKASDDRGFAINTLTDLVDRWSEDKDGTVYAIIAESVDAMNGAVYLEIVSPRLEFAEMAISGRLVILRDGEPVRLRKSDTVKLIRVQSNVGVDVAIALEISDNPAELRLARAGAVFARIPIVGDAIVPAAVPPAPLIDDPGSPLPGERPPPELPEDLIQ